MSEVQRKTESALITPDFLQTIEPELVRLFQSRILQKINRIETSRWRKILMLVAYLVILVSIFVGLGLGLGLVFFDQSICRSQTINVFILIIFSFLLYLFRSYKSFNRLITPDYQKSSLKTARRLANLSIKQAKIMAPYVAEYEYKNDVVSYYRIKDDVVNFAWSRKMPTIKVEGKGFILFFKKENSISPSIIILTP